MRLHLIPALFILTLLFACKSPGKPDDKEMLPAPGHWRAVLELPGAVLPFQMIISYTEGSPLVAILNADDTLVVKEAMITGDTFTIHLPVYHASIIARYTDSTLKGGFYNYYRGADYMIPFSAKFGEEHRFFKDADARNASVEGRWEVWFNPSDTIKANQAIGVFRQEGARVTGTFLQASGDLRFMEGQVHRDTFYLSTFDGGFVLLYHAALGDTMRGTYWSGNHSSGSWVAWRNDTLTLPDATGMAAVATGKIPFDINLSDIEGKSISLNSPPYADKPVIIQIGGTWCPNCKDEGRLLKDLYEQYNTKGLEIIGLSFERTDTAQALRNIERMVAYLELPFPVYFAGRGSREVVQAVLPQLVNFYAYPTSIFVRADRSVAAVHTGFSGPADPDTYASEVALYRQLVRELVGD
jgi:thiol-disulfide isomerase/thioredoxin